MIRNSYLNDDERRFFGQTPDLPPEKLCGADAAAASGDVGIREAWNKIRQESQAVLAPPSLEAISTRLAKLMDQWDQHGRPLGFQGGECAGIRSDLKSHREILLRLDTAGTADASGALDEVEESLEQALLAHWKDAPVEDSQAIINDFGRSEATSAERKTALLRLLAWLEGLL